MLGTVVPPPHHGAAGEAVSRPLEARNAGTGTSGAGKLVPGLHGPLSGRCLAYTHGRTHPSPYTLSGPLSNLASMPALEPVPGVAKVTFRGSFGVATWANILHIARPGEASGIDPAAWTAAEATGAAAIMRARWAARFAPQVNVSVTLTSTEVVDLTDDEGEVGSDLTNVSGTLAGTQCPAQVSCCVSWREALHYRGGHPRTYLPPPTTSQLSSGTLWTTAYQSAVETAMNAVITDLAAASGTFPDGLKLVAVHRTRAHATLQPPLVKIITAAVVDNRIDTQRRRLGPDV